MKAEKPALLKPSDIALLSIPFEKRNGQFFLEKTEYKEIPKSIKIGIATFNLEEIQQDDEESCWGHYVQGF